MKSLLGWWKTGENKSLIKDPAKVDKTFNRKRKSVIWSVVLGYGIFYIGRLTISVAKKPMLDSGVIDATQLGLIGAMLFYAYAIGKLTNGFLADRANIRKFMATGLFVSAIVNIIFGFMNAFYLFAILWLINGWFQSMGSAPSVVSITQWFSNKERGTYYGIWAASHNIGEGLTFIGTSAVVAAFGWRMGFVGPGVVCLFVAAILYFTLADRPETYGLPGVADFKDDHSAGKTKKKSIKEFQLQVLRSPVVIKVGLAATFLYTVRYAIHSWGPLYLQEAKGISLMEAGTIMGIATMFGLGGAIFSGWFSDNFFNSKRNIPAFIMGIVLIIGLLLLRVGPQNNLWLNGASLAIFEFALGSLVVYIGGLWAVDLLPVKAAGSVKGIIGIFSYVGAATQDWISGLLIDKGKVTVEGVTTYDFSYAYIFWIGAAVVALLIPLTLWKEKANE
jgi:OPA family sugar phosphate sensor protein UhpC-like MFS transporter